MNDKKLNSEPVSSTLPSKVKKHQQRNNLKDTKFFQHESEKI